MKIKKTTVNLNPIKILGNVDPHLTEAFDTYRAILCEKYNEDKDYEIINHYVDIMEEKLFEEDLEYNKCSAKELKKYKRIHKSFHEDIKSIKYQGAIIIVIDEDSNKSLVIDGNHRMNTFLKFCPNQEVHYHIVNAHLP